MIAIIIVKFAFEKCNISTIIMRLVLPNLQSKKRKDVDLRQLLNAKKPPPVYSIADKVASLTRNKLDDESDQDEESELVIEVPTEDEDKERGKLFDSEQSKNCLFSL